LGTATSFQPVSRPDRSDVTYPCSRPEYQGLYIWATIDKNTGEEKDGKHFVPHFTDNPDKACTVYANVDPYKSNQQVNPRAVMYAIHDNSPRVYIRYIAKHRVRTEVGNLAWFVMVHTTDHPDEPWGFVQASCLFGP
jgi:hypothetical protein